jgi:hypothetical protein
LLSAVIGHFPEMWVEPRSMIASVCRVPLRMNSVGAKAHGDRVCQLRAIVPGQPTLAQPPLTE